MCAGIQTRQCGHIIGRQLIRVGITQRDRSAAERIQIVHHGKPCMVIGSWSRPAGNHVQIQLRPSHAQHAAEHPYQPVFHIGQLRRLQRALAIDDHQSVLKICSRTEVINTSIHCVPKTL